MKMRSPLTQTWLVFCLSILIIALSAQAFAASSKISARSQELLTQAKEQGKTSVVILVATAPGQTKSVVSGLTSLGASIRYTDDTLGYIRALIPTKSVDAAAKIAGVQALDLNEIIPLDLPRPEGEAETQVNPPDANTPSQNAYMPTGDIGAPQFVAQHPTWDGRGVVVGILDTGVTLDHPALLTTSTGERRVLDWVTYTDPVTDNDPTWIAMTDQVSGATFTYKSVQYTAPASKSYRIGIFDERDARLGGELGNDVNRDGNPQGSNGKFAVLWDTGTNTVWVDTNQNNSFVDEKAMTDYRVRYDVSYFGTDNGATAVAERVPFVIQTNGKDKYVNIGIVSGAHGSHVAGIISANHLFGGPANGAAPGVKLVSVRACLFVAGCTSSALLEGMIFVTKQANVDLVNMSIGGLPALNDGNNARAVLYNRLIAQTNAQLFFSAGNNGPGINTVGDPGLVTDVVAAGAYVTKESWLANYGAIADKDEGLFVFSSRGPREDGGLKPNIVAPGSAVSSVPMWQVGQPVAGTYTLPPGYAMFNGTSMASPMTAGGAALLISAAKQMGVQYQPAQLRKAIYSSARQIHDFAAHEQGNGLVQIGAAWDLLSTNLKIDTITSSAPVSTVISGLLATPNKGLGLYLREGLSANQSDARQISFLRSKGSSQSATYDVELSGNDGTFTLGSHSLSLANGVPQNLGITINASTPGVHSALLNLREPGSNTIAYQTLVTVVATEPFTAGNVYRLEYPGSTARPDKSSFYFNVPPGALFRSGALNVTGRVRYIRFHPYGLAWDSTDTTAYQTGGSQQRDLTNAFGGVWEVTVDTSRSSPTSPATYTAFGTILQATISPNPDLIASATISLPVNRTYTATNTGGDFTGNMVGSALGSANRLRPTIATGESQIRTVQISGGTTNLRAKIGNPADLRADLDLFVYNCTSGTCVAAGQSAGSSSEESVSIGNPAAGTWAVQVVGYAVTTGTTAYDYLDIFANPVFGTISVTDAAALRPNGALWTAPGVVTANQAPAAGRVLQGTVSVVTGSSPVASADVVVQSVTP